MGSGGKGDEHVEVQVSEFVGGIAVLGAHFCQHLSRLQPVPFCRRQDGMVSRQGPQELALGNLGGAPPQLGEHDR